MRLSPSQCDAIKQQAVLIFGDRLSVYVFGSRTDDQARGGDIDLFIELYTCTEQAVAKSLQLNAALQALFGMQKIDIIVHQPTDAWFPVHLEAKQYGILL